MKKWALVLCEGAHDQKALACLACVCGGWTVREHNELPRKLPDELKKTYPSPIKLPSGAYRHEPPPDYLLKAQNYLVIRGLGGYGKALSETAFVVLKVYEPPVVAVVLDADERGSAEVEDLFRAHYAEIYPHATGVKAGELLKGSPGIGLWVTPNNRDNGKMETLLIAAARRKHARHVKAGEKFVAELGKFDDGDWVKHRDKALLGAIHQTVTPGASLAVCLRDSSCWFDEGMKNTPPFSRLLEFLESLVA